MLFFDSRMSKLSGMPRSQLDMYHIWEIADHIMINIPNGLEITDWERENEATIMYLNDMKIYLDEITIYFFY